MKNILLTLTIVLAPIIACSAQQSVARQWNEVLLDAIRHDISRPTVHARNLYQVSALVYEAWATYDEVADNHLLGHTTGEYIWEFEGIEIPGTAEEVLLAQEKAVSYTAYRLIKHRFRNSPGAFTTLHAADSLMLHLGYDTAFVSTDYTTNDPGALGNYLAFSCLEFGLVDYSNEIDDYDFSDDFYSPVNPALNPMLPGNPDIIDRDNWQPLAINGTEGRRFLSPQWGKTTAFSLKQEDLNIYTKNDQEYYVYHDPGPPPAFDSLSLLEMDDFYKWNFALVAIWSGHLDPTNGVLLDISPAALGNIPNLPETEAEMRSFYNLIDGGVNDLGYTENPKTGLPYEHQFVPMGDFGRVLAEFWADGPNSETPPGHWFTILNYVSDHPLFEKKFEGQGEILSDLEWDVKAYLTLGGAMHDVAVAVWGIKSYYDYIRPISAIRAMADLGQCSDDSDISYNPGGIPLVPDHIELVRPGDSLAGDQNEHVGKIKLYAWRGPEYVGDHETDFAGVGWILAENWWPYQAPSFVTPPFAGYVSGHSTFSRAAAEVMTFLTGDEFFPGGMGVFDAGQNEYLIFEDGPSVNMQLQWATYRDASDQASLSRIWGGIHPPVDDIPGRKIGARIGQGAFEHAKLFFEGRISSVQQQEKSNLAGYIRNYPNPAFNASTFEYTVRDPGFIYIELFDQSGSRIQTINQGYKTPGFYSTEISLHLRPGIYLYRLSNRNENSVSPTKKLMIN